MNNLFNVPHTPFQQYQQLNGHLLNQPYNRVNLQMYGEGLIANANLINQQRRVLMDAGMYPRISPELRNLDEQLILYMNAASELKKIEKGLKRNVIPQGGSRKKGGKVSKDYQDAQRVAYEIDLKKDIRKIRKLLGDVEEKLGFNDLVTARRDLKEITKLIEQNNVFALHRNYPSPIPQDILDQYEGLMAAITRMELGISGNNSSTNSSINSGDIQFTDADWEFLGAGISREKKNYNTNLRMVGGADDFDFGDFIEDFGGEEQQQPPPPPPPISKKRKRELENALKYFENRIPLYNNLPDFPDILDTGEEGEPPEVEFEVFPFGLNFTKNDLENLGRFNALKNIKNSHTQDYKDLFEEHQEVWENFIDNDFTPEEIANIHALDLNPVFRRWYAKLTLLYEKRSRDRHEFFKNYNYIMEFTLNI